MFFNKKKIPLPITVKFNIQQANKKKKLKFNLMKLLQMLLTNCLGKG